jgi:hypothetical protein
MNDPSHARRTDPDTSHATAKLVKMNAQRYRVLGSYYKHRREMIDHEAYALAGMHQSGYAHQRCSDLRNAGWIVPTGNKGTTPFKKPARKCVITTTGIQAYNAWGLFYD